MVVRRFTLGALMRSMIENFQEYQMVGFNSNRLSYFTV